MNAKELMEYTVKDFGIFGKYLLWNEFISFGDLPILPKDYKLISVRRKTDIDIVRSKMQSMNAEIDKLYPNSESHFSLTKDDYEDRCFLTLLLFTNIFDFWFEDSKFINFKNSDGNFAALDSFMMDLWNWVKGKITTKTLQKHTKEFYKAVTK